MLPIGTQTTAMGQQSRLPSELILSILELLGPEFLHERPARLLVSRSWYRTALSVHLSEISLTTDSLAKFIWSIIHVDGYLESVQSHLKVFHITLGNFENWSKGNLKCLIPFRKIPGFDKLGECDRADKCIAALNEYYLLQLGKVLRNCSRLEKLSLAAGTESHDDIFYPQDRDYLLSQPINGILQLQHLRSLQIDMTGTFFIDLFDHLQSHVCLSIRALLPTLRQLRCRLTSTCPRILDLPEDSPQLDLEELIINLCIPESADPPIGYAHVPDPPDTQYYLPNVCRKATEDELHENVPKSLKAGLLHVMSLMKNPKIVRLLTPRLNALEMVSFDVKTQRGIVVPPEATWGQDCQDNNSGTAAVMGDDFEW